MLTLLHAALSGGLSALALTPARPLQEAQTLPNPPPVVATVHASSDTVPDRTPPSRVDSLLSEAPRGSLTSDTTVQRLLTRLQELDGFPLPIPYVVVPGISENTPTAFGGSLGQGGVGFALQSRARYNPNKDAVIGGGVALGDPTRLGVDVGIAILDLRPNRAGRGGFGQRGTMTVTIHRLFNQRSAIAVGLNNVLSWGRTSTALTYYAVTSHRFGEPGSRRGRIFGSIGIGNGDFRLEQHVLADRKTVGGFANISYSIAKPVRVFAEWTGQDLALGASVVPLRGVPVVVTASVTDVTGTAGDGPRPMVSTSYAFSLIRTE